MTSEVVQHTSSADRRCPEGKSAQYALITSAYNEEQFISRALDAVISQNVKPVCWTIVSDGSTDGTDDVVKAYSDDYDFIRFLRVDNANRRGVIRKVNALRLAYENMRDIDFDFVGNLDADVSIDSTYFERLLLYFAEDPLLGVSGGMVYEKSSGEFKSRFSNRDSSVAHAAQLVRRDCYEAIGGYLPLKYGGEDWCAEVTARMLGWRAHAFTDLRVMHHRATGAADLMLRHCFKQGRMDYSMGSHPAFELLKCVRRIPEHPFLFGAMARLLGFCTSSIRQEPKLVSQEFVSFLRNEQIERLKCLFST